MFIIDLRGGFECFGKCSELQIRGLRYGSLICLNRDFSQFMSRITYFYRCIHICTDILVH